MATGWGRKSWGEDNWGDLSDTLVSVSGISLSITNRSTNGVSFSAQADAQLSSDQSKFGGTSLELDGSGDRIQSTDITLGTDSYTWETFAYFNSFASTQCIWDAGENVGASQNPVVFITSTNIQISYAGGTYINVAHGMSVDTWHHIAIVRDGTGTGNLKAYIDGTNVGTANLGSVGAGATNHVLGGNFAGTFTMNGYLDESRLTRKVVYTGNFTPPSSELSNDRDSDIWLLHYDGTAGSTDIVNSALFQYTEADGNVTPTGQTLTATNAGAVGGTSVSLTVTGISATVSPGQAVVGIGVPVTTAGLLNTSVGTATVDETKLTGEGWGRDAWGSFAWGDNYSVIATGQSLTSAQGSVIAKADVDVSVTGLDLLTITQGLSSIQIDNNVFVFASEDQLDTSVGSTSQTGLANVGVTGNSASTSIGQVVPEPKIPVDVTGVSLTASIGTISLVQTTNETATGQSATISLGTVDPVAVYPVTTAGLLTSSVGSVTVTGTGVISLTGIGLTANIGSVNVTAWSEIDPGVNNVWTEVDKAA